MCDVHKPRPFGNSRHTLCCDINSILWRAHILEVKDRQNQLSPKKWEELGKNVGLMLQICGPIFSTVKCVVLDSGFFVSKGLTALLEIGV